MVQDEYDVAAELMTTAWEHSKRVNGSRHRDSIKAQIGLAWTHSRTERYSASDSGETPDLGARSSLEEALAAARRELGEKDMQTFIARSNLADHVYDLDSEMAESLTQENLAMAESSLGPNHPKVIGQLVTLCNMKDTAAGQLETLREIVKRSEVTYPSTAPFVLQTQVQLAKSLIGADRIDEAKVLANKLRATAMEKGGTGSVFVAEADRIMGRIAIEEGRIAEGEKLLLSAYETIKTVSPNEGPSASHLSSELFRLYYYRLKDFEKAKAIKLDEKAFVERNRGRGSRRYAEVCYSIAKMSRKLGQHEESVSLMRQVIPILERGGKTNDFVVRSRLWLGISLHEIGETDEATPMIEEVIKYEGWKQIYKWYHWLAISTLGQIHASKGDFEQAIPMLVSVVDAYEGDVLSHFPEPRAFGMRLEIREQLVEIYRSAGKTAEVEELEPSIKKLQEFLKMMEQLDN